MTENPEISDRPNISREIAARLRDRIVDGRLAPGERINEVRLAASLRVSRTPLREALAGLSSEGSLVAVPRRGFFVAALSEEEFRHLYPIRALLDPEALALSGIPSPDRIARLAALNEKILAAAKPEAVLRLDEAWHLELLAGCPNPILVDLIRGFMARTRRYELALVRERGGFQASVEDHEAILRALGAGDLGRACAALRRNMENGTAPVLRWLAGRRVGETGQATDREPRIHGGDKPPRSRR